MKSYKIIKPDGSLLFIRTYAELLDYLCTHSECYHYDKYGNLLGLLPCFTISNEPNYRENLKNYDQLVEEFFNNQE